MSRTLCARAESTWEIACTWSALRSSIQWCWFGRAEKSGSGDKIRSVAEKGPFSTLPGKYTENFGQGLQSDLRQEMPWGQDPRILVGPLQKL